MAPGIQRHSYQAGLSHDSEVIAQELVKGQSWRPLQCAGFGQPRPAELIPYCTLAHGHTPMAEPGLEYSSPWRTVKGVGLPVAGAGLGYTSPDPHAVHQQGWKHDRDNLHSNWLWHLVAVWFTQIAYLQMWRGEKRLLSISVRAKYIH